MKQARFTYKYSEIQHEIALELNRKIDSPTVREVDVEAERISERNRTRAEELRAQGIEACADCGRPLREHEARASGRLRLLPAAITFPEVSEKVDLSVLDNRTYPVSKKFFWHGKTNQGRQIESTRSLDRRLREGFRTLGIHE